MMLTDFNEAYQIVLDHSKSFGVEEVSLEESFGRVLAENVYADRELPPYDRVTMDGIALNFDSIKSKKLLIESIVAAGDAQYELKNPEACVEIMTGAVLPKGTDTVIRYEDLKIEDGIVMIEAEFSKAQNVHFKGLDRKKGDLVIKEKARIGSAEMGVCASVGKSRLKVFALPKTVVISTGNELVEITEQPLPHQIRRGNVYRIASTLKERGIPVSTLHLNDDPKEINEALQSILVDFDLIVLSGGVSKGKYDYLPQCLDEMGVRKLFHKVAQRPGKPLWFGVHDNGTTVFALPGNPVSSFMCTHVYLLQWLNSCLGIAMNEMPYGKLTKDVNFKPDLDYFLEVKLSYNKDAEILAEPIKGNGSGDLANLVDADAFIHLPRGRNLFKAGEKFPIIPYRNLSL